MQLQWNEKSIKWSFSMHTKRVGFKGFKSQQNDENFEQINSTLSPHNFENNQLINIHIKKVDYKWMKQTNKQKWHKTLSINPHKSNKYSNVNEVIKWLLSSQQLQWHPFFSLYLILLYEHNPSYWVFFPCIIFLLNSLIPFINFISLFKCKFLLQFFFFRVCYCWKRIDPSSFDDKMTIKK